MITIAGAVITNVAMFLGLCIIACSIGMLFTMLLLFAKRNSPNYDIWENRVAKVFWRIIFLCFLISAYLVVILK